MDKVFRLGLIGAGNIARTYSTAIERLRDECRLVAVADCVLERAVELGQRHRAGACRRAVELEAFDLDAVIVCSPPKLHFEHVMCLLDRGIHVLCEKPLATSADLALQMVEAAHRRDVVFTMASKFRFVRDVIRAKAMLDRGGLGELVLYENSFTAAVDMSKRWNSQREISGGGVLIDNGTHSLDIMRYFLGPLAEIRAIEGKRIQKIDVEDNVHVFARSACDVLGSIDLSWSIAKDLPYFVCLYGSAGAIQVGWRESRAKLNGERQWQVFGDGYDKVAAFEGQLRNFFRTIRGLETLTVSVDDALQSVVAVEAAYQSMVGDCWSPILAGR